MTTPLIYQHGDQYVDDGYVTRGYFRYSAGRGIQLSHAAGSLTLSRSPRYPQFAYQFIQPQEKTPAGWITSFDPILAQMPFDVLFPIMPDSELAALRAYLFSTVPLFDAMTWYEVKTDIAMQVRIASPSIKVKHIKRGFNEVGMSLVRV
jgi:hypothetical protein